MTRTFIDVHVLQTVPPSNVNRDDTGSPKTAYYGGVQRARVSSQSWKRATRKAFDDLLDLSQLGVRTTRVVTLLAERIHERAPEIAPEEASRHASAALQAVGIKLAKPRVKKAEPGDEVPAEDADERSGYLVFLSNLQVDQLADLAISSVAQGKPLDKKAAKEAADTSHSVDVALFGRMVADDKELNVDAAVQVAHALSVHAVDTEFDYFTAVDDRNVDDSGAGMIGTVEFTSSTLYRYATVNMDALQANLGTEEAAAQAVEAFLRAFVTSMPTGKQNTFANRTLPDAVVVMVRRGQPVNLVGAFETPIENTDGTSRLATACARLTEHATEVDRAFATTPQATFVVRVGRDTAGLDTLAEAGSFDELVAGVASVICSGTEEVG